MITFKILERELGESRVLGIALGIGRELERDYRESRFRKLLRSFLDRTSSILMLAIPERDILPGRLFDLLRPSFLVPLASLIFLSISRHDISGRALFVYILGTLLLFIGCIRGERIDFPRLEIERIRLEFAGSLLLVVSIAFLFLDLIDLGRIPLLWESWRRYLNVDYTTIAFLLVPASGILLGSLLSEVEERRRKLSMFLILTALSTALISLLGFKTEIMACLITCSVIACFLGALTPFELLLATLIFASLSLVVAQLQLSLAGIRASYLDFLISRASFTMSVFDYLVSASWIWGSEKGLIHLSSFSSMFEFVPGPRIGPRTIIANMVGARYGVTITATLFGPMMADFGIWGVIIISYILGLILGSSYSFSRSNPELSVVYALPLAFALVGVETGIVDFIVIAYYAISAAVLLYASRRS